MDDFIFGTLATEKLRQEHVRALLGEVTHRARRVPRDPQPGQPIHLELTVGPHYPAERAWVYWTTDGSDPEGRNGKASNGKAIAMEQAAIDWDTQLWGYIQTFQVELPGQPEGTILRYNLTAGLADGSEVRADQGANYAVYIDDDPLPDWTRQAVIYQIFVDRFNPGKGKSWQTPETPAGFYGGALKGITEKLEYIQTLGANVLWLTPIFPSPSHHGYDPTSIFDIERRLGSREDLRELLDSAHALGLRVLLDFVPNHWSSLHPTFQAALSSPDNPYTRWYNFEHWPDQYECFFGVKSLPQINLRHPEARQHILDAAVYWLEFGVDGYRVDYALGPTPDFWADFRQATRSARPDCWVFGEVVEPSDSQIAFEGLLDGCLDFILLEAIRNTFAFRRWSAVQFSSFLDRHEKYFPVNFSRPSFLDNHDMNRFLWAAGGDLRRLKIGALCQFTLNGPPVLYYGTEVGLSQKRDVRQDGRGLPEESRLPMLWGDEQNRELHAFYRALIALRKNDPIFSTGIRQGIGFGPDILAYRKSENPVNEDAGSGYLILINLTESPQRIDVPDGWRKIVFKTEQGCDLLKSGERTQMRLPPLAGAVIA